MDRRKFLKVFLLLSSGVIIPYFIKQKIYYQLFDENIVKDFQLDLESLKLVNLGKIYLTKFPLSEENICDALFKEYTGGFLIRFLEKKIYQDRTNKYFVDLNGWLITNTEGQLAALSTLA